MASGRARRPGAGTMQALFLLVTLSGALGQTALPPALPPASPPLPLVPPVAPVPLISCQIVEDDAYCEGGLCADVLLNIVAGEAPQPQGCYDTVMTTCANNGAAEKVYRFIVGGPDPANPDTVWCRATPDNCATSDEWVIYQSIPSPPPPPASTEATTPRVISFSLTASGSVADYTPTVKNEIKASVASSTQTHGTRRY